jgi:hypothetical protein
MSGVAVVASFCMLFLFPVPIPISVPVSAPVVPDR